MTGFARTTCGLVLALATLAAVPGAFAVAPAEIPAAERAMIERQKTNDLLAGIVAAGTVEIYVEGRLDKPLVAAGTAVELRTIGDRDFLVVAEGNDTVYIRPQSIVAFRVHKAK